MPLGRRVSSLMVLESQIVCQRTRSGMMAEDQSYPASRLGPCAPRSAVVPFGVFEKVMSHADNKGVADEYKRLVDKELHAAGDPLKVLEKLKRCIKDLKAPSDMVAAVKQALVDSDIIQPGQLEGGDWDDAFLALKGVWASKWNDRAYYSCKKANIGVEFVQMAVLVQRLVEAEYAFVIHTVNPSNDDKDYMYAEVVVGLGETRPGKDRKSVV